jgi:hypothetical protein
MFRDEYRLNSWRDQLRVLAPPILISIIVLGVLFSLSAFLPNKLTISGIIDKVKSVISPSKYSSISASKLDELEKQL